MPFVGLAGGAGPRHFAFSRCGNFGYAVNELENTITAFRYDARSGTLHPVQEISTLPHGHNAVSYASEIQVHPEGRFLYAANRGHNSLSVFGINPADGRLALRQVAPSGGDFPRHFAIDPSGRWLLAANERSDLIAGFAIDSDSGALGRAFDLPGIPGPACIVFPRMRGQNLCEEKPNGVS
jgi:6-phosphogluconolactonase